jgi:hypothetical protein
MSTKTPGKKASGGKANALQKPLQPSEELAAAVGSEPVPRRTLSGKRCLEESRAKQLREGARLVAIGRSRVLPRRELVIQRGDLVQPIDDLFVGHRGCVATSPFRFSPEERGIGRNRGVRQHLIHIDLTFARQGPIHPALGCPPENSVRSDSPMEGAGFEPPVPLAKEGRVQAWNSSLEVTRRLLRP